MRSGSCAELARSSRATARETGACAARPVRLEQILSANGIEHDVKEYPDAGHGFLNDHDPSAVPRVFAVMAKFARTDYHEPSTRDARRRIAAFFAAYLS